MISVIIPCYNVEKYISKTLNSILAQTYQDFEIITINDGSTDNTIKVLEGYKSIDKRIKIIDNKINKGVSSTRNIGIENSKGDYLFFIDGDDYIEKEYFTEAIHKFLQDPLIDIALFAFDRINEKNEIIKYYKYKDMKINNIKALKLFFNRKIAISIGSFIIKKNIIIQNNITYSNNISYGEDQELIIKSLMYCRKIFYLNKRMFHYIQRNESAVNIMLSKKRIDLLKAHLKIKEYISQNYEYYSIMPYLNIYLCIEYFYLLSEGEKKNANLEFYQEIKKYEYILKYYKFNFTKNSILIYMLIMIYKNNKRLLLKILKKYL